MNTDFPKLCDDANTISEYNMTALAAVSCYAVIASNALLNTKTDKNVTVYKLIEAGKYRLRKWIPDEFDEEFLWIAGSLTVLFSFILQFWLVGKHLNVFDFSELQVALVNAYNILGFSYLVWLAKEELTSPVRKALFGLLFYLGVHAYAPNYVGSFASDGSVSGTNDLSLIITVFLIAFAARKNKLWLLSFLPGVEAKDHFIAVADLSYGALVKGIVTVGGLLFIAHHSTKYRGMIIPRTCVPTSHSAKLYAAVDKSCKIKYMCESFKEAVNYKDDSFIKCDPRKIGHMY